MFSDKEKTLLRKKVYALMDIGYCHVKKGDQGLIVAFGQASGNPCIKWDNGSTGFGELGKDIAVQYQGSIEYILDNLLSSMVKSEDAPCSSYTHLAQAIDALYKMAGEYTASTEEHKEELAQALEHMRLLRGN